MLPAEAEVQVIADEIMTRAISTAEGRLRIAVIASRMKGSGVAASIL